MIKYLKSKYTRESFFRADLAHQKTYLSMVVAQKQRRWEKEERSLSSPTWISGHLSY